MKSEEVEKEIFPRVRAMALLLVGVLALFPSARAVSDSDEEERLLQVQRGAQGWAEHCTRCHNARDPDELRNYEWDISINHMRLVANIPGDVARDILLYMKESN